MHSLINILRHAKVLGMQAQVLSDLDKVTDLNYLSHIVFRCYERDDQECSRSAAAAEAVNEDLDPSSPGERQKNIEKARYRVEISMSAGVQVFEDGKHVPWPKGGDLTPQRCQVAPLQIVASSMELQAVEKFLTDTVKEFGREPDDDEDEDEKPSDNN
jgi:hypothetical protein